MRRILTLAMAGTLALAGAACDNDENGGEGDLEAYCALTAALDDVEGVPTDDQLDAIEDAAPPEIEDDVNTAADALRDADPEDPEATFDDPEVSAAFTNLEEFEDENCPARDGDTDDTTDDTADDTDEPDDTDTTEDTTDDTTDETTDDTAGDTTETS